MSVESGPAREPTEVRRRVGRYELLTPIGKGGMAEVHLAMQRGPAGFEKLVVIKLVHDHLATQRAFVDMLLDEGRLAGMIKHPNVVDIYDVGEDNGRFFVAMEYLDGEPLLAILRVGADGERLDPLSTARVIADTAEGLEAAHRLKALDGKPLGVIHHDVSLGNIVVLYNGQVKLVDFGVARARLQGDTKRDAIQGKFAYMAPEKLAQGEVDRRSDIWSLGVVAWEALTLQRLFKGSNDSDTMQAVLELEIPAPSTRCADVPTELDPIIMRALERDPGKRYSTAKAFGLDLEEVLRKRGYAGKNDRIAKYMATAFASEIAVREKLVAELSAGRTSQEAIDAFRSISSPSARPIEPSEESAGDGGPRLEPRPATKDDESIRTLQGWLDDERERRARSPWRGSFLPFAAGGVVLLIMIIALAGRGGGRADPATVLDAPQVAAIDAAQVAIDAAPVVITPDAAEPAIDAAAVGSGSGSDEIEMPATPPLEKPREVPREKPREKPRETPRENPRETPRETPREPGREPPAPTGADGLTKRGFDQLRANDAKGATASFSQATKLNSNYAPAWYGLARAYEASGLRRGPIKAAYQRYLSLAPNGANAADARARIQKL